MTRDVRMASVAGIAIALAVSCGKKEGGGAPPVQAPAPPSAPATELAGKDATPAAAAPAPAPAPAPAAAAKEGAGEGGDLHAEEREQDPRSRNVHIKLSLSPPARGVVMWGRKRLAELRPGDMVVEIDRPRNSGPLDLAIRAEGYLPHHVRLFTDRDDRLSVRLITPAEATGVLGYRPPAEPSETAPAAP